jgi:type IV pilus assembly protein PilM
MWLARGAVAHHTPLAHPIGVPWLAGLGSDPWLCSAALKGDRMQAYPAVWGIDIGQSTIKAVRMVREGSAPTVSGYSIEPIEVDDGGDRNEAFEAAMVNLVNREDLRALPVVISLSGSQSFSKIVNIPVLSENQKNLRRMVELEARDAIPGDLDELYWEYHVVPALDGESMDVALFAARKELVRQLVELCSKLGLELAGISISSLAIYNFVRYDQDFDFDETVAVLDVGAENTELLVYQGDALWMRSLTISGNAITRAFQKKFRVSLEEAEKLKTQVEDSRQADKILKVIEPNLMELVTEVTRSLGFYRQSNRGAQFETLVVAGNTFRLPGLDQFMANRLNMAILSLIELERIEVDDAMDREEFLEDLQSLGVALGLGLQGLGLSDANVDLLPKEVFVQNTLAKKRWAMIAVLLMLPLAHVVRDMYLSSQMSNNWVMQTDIRDVVKRVDEEEKIVREVTGQIGAAARQLAGYRQIGRGAYAFAAIEREVWRTAAAAATNAEAQQAYFGDDPSDAIVVRDPSVAAKGDPILLPAYVTSVKVGRLDGGSLKLDEVLQQGVSSLPGAQVQFAVSYSDTNIARLMRQNILTNLKDMRYPAWRLEIMHGASWREVLSLTAVDAELPSLLAEHGTPDVDLGFSMGWTYIDPSFEDSAGNIIERRESREIPNPRLYEYALTFVPQVGAKK